MPERADRDGANSAQVGKTQQGGANALETMEAAADSCQSGVG